MYQINRLWIVAAMLIVGMGGGQVRSSDIDTSGVGGEGLEADSGQIEFIAEQVPLPNNMTVGAMAYRAVLKAFLEDHPNYKVKPFSMPVVMGDTTKDTGPLMAIAAGIPPVLMSVNFRQSSTYIGRGFLEPLEVLLARVMSDDTLTRQVDDKGMWLADPTEAEIEQATREILDRIVDQIEQVAYRDNERSGDPTRHVWSLPYETGAMALLWRKDKFREVGLPNRPPKDWNELMEFCQKLNRPKIQQYALCFEPGPVISWYTYTFLVSSGTEPVTRNAETRRWEATFASRGAAEAIYYIWRLAREPYERDGKMFKGAAKLASPYDYWSKNQLAMRFEYLFDKQLADLNPQEVGIAPVPLSHRGTRGSELNASMFGVFADATPGEKLAAMKYLWFLTSDEAKRIHTKVLVENGYGLFVNPINLKKFGYDRLYDQVPKEWSETFALTLENGIPEPYGRNTQTIYKHLSRPINQSLAEDMGSLGADRAIEVIMGLLKESEDRVNLKVLGNISPEEMRKRRIIAGIVIGVIGLMFSLGMIHVWRYFSVVAKPFTGHTHWKRFVWGYVLLLPGLGLVLFWQYLPLAGGGLISLYEYELVKDSVFVGVDNFAYVLYNEMFWQSLGRTFYFVALSIGLGFWPPILLAILLQEVPTNAGKYFFRTVYYLPAVIAGVIVIFLWKQLYDPTEYGVLNQLLMMLNNLDPFSATVVKWLLLGMWGSLIWFLFFLPFKISEMGRGMKAGMFMMGLGLLAATVWPLVSAYIGPSDLVIENMISKGEDPESVRGLSAVFDALSNLVGGFGIVPLGWIQSPQMAMTCIVIPSVWAGAGPGCILYLAALKTVPDDLYEAADIDGASNLHKIFYIVLPQLKYLITIQFIAAVVGAFKYGTETVLAMTQGGPNDATLILALHIFEETFLDLEYGIGSAMAWVLGALLIGFTAFQLKMLSRAEFKSGANI